MRELDALVGSYVHLDKLPRAKDALRELQKIASLVKPIMRRRGWHVGSLTEFWPDQQNLLGLNVNHGQKVCLRLRYAGDKTQFMPLEHVVDTMLHELCHNVIGPHNAEFHNLWNQLRDEYDDLKYKGYTGEGFMSEGNRLGGRNLPMHEVRRQALQAAERRKPTKNAGQKLGGRAVPRSANIRSVIADAVQRRQSITQGCGSGSRDSEWIANEATYKGFRTQAEEDQANDRAIAEALWELAQEDKSGDPDQALMGNTQWKTDGLSWDTKSGLEVPQQRDRSRSPGKDLPPPQVPEPSSWLSDRDSYPERKPAGKALLPATTYQPIQAKRRKPSAMPTSVARLRPESDTGQPRPDSDVLGNSRLPGPSDPPPPVPAKPTTGYPPEKVASRQPPPISTHPAYRTPTPEPAESSAVSHKSNASVSSMTSSDPRTAISSHPSAFLSPTVYVRPEHRFTQPAPTANSSANASTISVDTTTTARSRTRSVPYVSRISTSSSSSASTAPIPASTASPNPGGPKPRDSMWTCPICTLCNPSTFLTCDACTAPRPCHGTIDDFSAISDLGPDAYPTQSPLSPAELPTSATTPCHDSGYFRNMLPDDDSDFWQPAKPGALSSSSGTSGANTPGTSSTQRRSMGPPRSRPVSLQSGAARTAASLAAATRNEIPAPLKKLGWNCGCGTFMEEKWWTCTSCGRMKTSS